MRLRRGAPTRSRRGPCPSRAPHPARRRRGAPAGRAAARSAAALGWVSLPALIPRPARSTRRDALGELDAITRRLRRECPWDREQDERSIVPHTVEEAYELADAVQGGDDARLLDELGDVLFQVVFLALLLEERGPATWPPWPTIALESWCAAIRTCSATPRPQSADEVLRNWDAIKR